MSTEQIQALQDSIVNDQKHVDLASSLSRLVGNKDFIKVVKEGYFNKEAIRLVHLKSDPSMQTPERQASILRDIDAIGSFRGFLDLIDSRGAQARRAIDTAEEQIVEIEQEGNE